MDYLLHIGILIAIYGILAISLNLLVGYTGMLSLAHAAFFGIGAYTTAILTTQFGLNFFVALMISVVFAALIGALVSLILRRIRGDYFALATLGINIIVFSILLGWQSFTNGPLGITGISAPSILGLTMDTKLSFFILSLVLVVTVYLFSRNLTRATFGKILQAIRDDELSARTKGFKTDCYRFLVFVISAGLAAIAGGLYASYISFIEPATFDILASIFILAAIILGGLARLPGSILGAASFIILQEALRFVGFSDATVGHMRLLVFGLLLVLVMRFKPYGLIGRYSL